MRGGSLKKIEKNIIPNVPTNKKVYTKASIKVKFLLNCQAYSNKQIIEI